MRSSGLRREVLAEEREPLIVEASNGGPKTDEIAGGPDRNDEVAVFPRQLNIDEISSIQPYQGLHCKVTDSEGHDLNTGVIRRWAGRPPDAYNKRTAVAKNWLLMDRNTVTVDNPLDRIEACDLLSPGQEFVCIKKMNRSATLSHLFAQGSVSANLLRRDGGYRKSVDSQIAAKWTGKSLNPDAPITFVYAVATARPGSLADSLFFFSLINLLTHYEQICALGPGAVRRLRRG